MSNVLFNALGGSAQTADDGLSQMLGQFEQFRNNFRGDARAEVQRLLNSGQMTQAQFNQLGQAANQIMRFIK